MELSRLSGVGKKKRETEPADVHQSHQSRPLFSAYLPPFGVRCEVSAIKLADPHIRVSVFFRGRGLIVLGVFDFSGRRRPRQPPPKVVVRGRSGVREGGKVGGSPLLEVVPVGHPFPRLVVGEVARRLVESGVDNLANKS